jgi:hypothetical protein
MGFFTMYFIVSTTEGADIRFYRFYKSVRNAFLAGAGMAANRT